MTRRSLAILALAAIASLHPAGGIEPARAAETPSPFAGNRSLAPTFRVRSVSGAVIDLAALRRQGPVLLDFWATWCRPCVASLPELEALHERLGPRGLSVIGISVDGPRNFAKVRPFAARSGLRYTIVLDEDGSLQQSYRVLAVPTSVLIDRDGTIVRIQQGYRPGELAELAKAIEALLPPAGADSTSAPGAQQADSSAAEPR